MVREKFSFFFEVFCKGRIRVYKVSIGKLGGFGFSEHLSLWTLRVFRVFVFFLGGFGGFWVVDC